MCLQLMLRFSNHLPFFRSLSGASSGRRAMVTNTTGDLQAETYALNLQLHTFGGKLNNHLDKPMGRTTVMYLLVEYNKYLNNTAAKQANFLKMPYDDDRRTS
ncbi:hypothetical protein DQ04_13411020 [Trypanosoma grayi]|uniref:hypothetical protein n=1 Tax=Trypanosoma grayi TaxID=71804 RepID=UPI0004F410D3|nr:hypothetical protein DQ04_13411020 [Trypanosoma grayi]KEG06545.1 hypothetical protein DQ04_13411020 [Trypanosoma grayi]